MLPVTKVKEQDQITKHYILLVNHTPNKWVWGLSEVYGIQMRSHKYPMMWKQQNLISKLEFRILYLLFTFVKGSGSFQVLWAVGWLTAAQPHTFGVIRFFGWVSVHSYKAFLVQLVDVQNEFTKPPHFIQPKAEEAAQNNQPSIS